MFKALQRILQKQLRHEKSKIDFSAIASCHTPTSGKIIVSVDGERHEYSAVIFDKRMIYQIFTEIDNYNKQHKHNNENICDVVEA